MGICALRAYPRLSYNESRYVKCTTLRNSRKFLDCAMEIEKHLDDYLNYLITNGNVQTYPIKEYGIHSIDDLKAAISIGKTLDFNELSEILEEDKFIYINWKSNTRDLLRGENNIPLQIKITIRGKYFIGQGGYAGKLGRMNREAEILADDRRTAQRNDILLVDYTENLVLWTRRLYRGTVAVAIGAIGLVLWEMRHFFEYCFHLVHDFFCH
jgi:hypothetical protein